MRDRPMKRRAVRVPETPLVQVVLGDPIGVELTVEELELANCIPETRDEVVEENDRQQQRCQFPIMARSNPAPHAAHPVRK